MISEWLRVMLEEIERKRLEREQGMDEERRRELELAQASRPSQNLPRA
jgi:uncharacterized NAD(P)/FAD-binding protein YdhS